LANKKDVEKDTVEREREEDKFGKAHPFPQELNAKLERARKDMLARKG
jgi:hypothetical protein